MTRTAGYLANVLTIPPLIFRFQFNPELLSEKRTFAYREDPARRDWGFDQTKNAKGVLDTIGGFGNDLKEIGSALVGTKGFVVDSGGKPRTFALEFALDARKMPDIPEPAVPGGVPDEGGQADDKRFGGRIEPSLAVLRSFMNPWWDPLVDIPAWIRGTKFAPPTMPPLCTLKLGGLDLDCVMTDLNIKITKFKPDLSPERAEVSLTLAEQTRSLSTGLDVLDRLVEVVKSYGQLTGADLVAVVPGVGPVRNMFET